MRRLVIKSKKINIEVQVFTPESEQDYLKLVAHECSNTLKRIRERASRIRREEFEKLIAL